jgi:hypothetical protein
MVNTDCKKAVVEVPPIVQPTAATNRPPVINAGPDITIAIPTSNANLALAVSDPDFNLTSVNCEKISGPTSAQINISDDWRSASAFALAEGVYEFELTGTDQHGLVGRDTVRITVTSNFQNYVKNALLPDASSITTLELPEDVWKNLKWVYYRTTEGAFGIDLGPIQVTDDSWGVPWYYVLLPDNKLSFYGGNPNEKFDLIIYY